MYGSFRLARNGTETVRREALGGGDDGGFPRRVPLKGGGAATEFFDDVAEANVHRDAVNPLAARGTVQGRGGRQYAPRADVNRAQMASFLMGYVNELVHLGVATPPEQD